MSEEKSMSTLERLSDARGTLEGRIVAIVLAVLLVMPVVGVTAFAEDEDEHGTAATEAAVETPVVQELPDTGTQPIAETAAPAQPAAPEQSTVLEDEPATDDDDCDPLWGYDTPVNLAVDISEGITLSYLGEFTIGKDDDSMLYCFGAEPRMNFDLDEGYELATQDPIVCVSASGVREPVVISGNGFSLPEWVMDGGATLIVRAKPIGEPDPDPTVSEPSAPEQPSDGWVEPISAQSVTAKAWCTTISLGQIDLSTDSNPALGTSAGMAPSALATSVYELNENRYGFHHAQLPTVGSQQTDNPADKGKYDASQAIDAIRFNQSLNDGAGSWEYLKGGSWAQFSAKDHQLVFYYDMILDLGTSNDDKFSVSAPDWPYTESQWVGGVSSATPPGVAIYQLYDVAGNLLGNQYRTYYWANTLDRAGLAVRLPEYWEVEAIRVRPVAYESLKRGVAYDKFASPSTFDGILQYKAPSAECDVYGQIGFSIPFAQDKTQNVWLIGIKVKALPSEQTLTVEYLDDATGSPIQEDATVAARKLDGTAAPSWADYVSIADGKLAGDPDSVEVTTDISNDAKVTISFTVNRDDYTSRHVRAELDGNTLKLYFTRAYGVAYEWSGLDLDGVHKVVGANGEKVAGLPHDDGKYVVGDEYTVNAVHNEGDVAYAIDDEGKVIAVYRFSGWKLDGSVVEGNQVMPEGGVTLTGAWEALTAGYKGTVSVEGQVYDGTSDYTETLETTLTDPTTGENPEPSRYIYKDKDGNELDGAPVDAGEYTVTAVWDATDTRPEVVSDPYPFAIAKRPVVLKSATATKVYDGTPLTKHELAEVEQPENGGFIEGQGVDVTYTGEITNPGTVENEFDYAAKEGTNLGNYTISTDNGVLEVTARDAADKIKVTLTARSSEVTYDGTKQSVEGLASVDAAMDGRDYAGSEQDDHAAITINGAAFTVSGYATGAAATNAGKWAHNIIAENGFVVLDANGNDVTDQFVVETVQGTLEIGQRLVTLTSESATKHYDGTALTKPTVAVSDEVFASEATAWATGSATNVADGVVENAIAVAAKQDAAEDANEFNKENYAITYACGTLQVLPQSIDPGDSTTPVDPEDPSKPVDPSDPFDPTDPDNPYKGAKVGDLADRIYNGQADAQAPVVTNINGKALTLSTDYTLAADDDRTNVRTVTITVTGTGNYIGTVTRTYEITPAPVKIIVDSAAKKFGEADPAFTGTIEGLFTNDRNGDALDSLGTVAYSRTNRDEAVGTYEDVLTATVTDRNPNYQEPEVVLGTFTITDADAADISAEGLTKTFDGQPASIEASTEDGWTLWYSTDGENWTEENPSFVDAGTYTVYVKATRPNHVDAGPVSATVVIERAKLVVRVDNASKVAGSADPEFTGTVEGEVEGYPLNGVAYFRTNDAEGVGTYADVLSATFDENPNYAVTVENGDFTITAIPVPATPPTPGPIDTIIDFLSTPIIGGTPGTDGPMVNIADDGTPMANIADDENPLGAFDHPLCWVHYYILLGIIITAIYGGGVIARRLNYNRKVKGYEDDVTGKEREAKEAKRPVIAPSKA